MCAAKSVNFEARELCEVRGCNDVQRLKPETESFSFQGLKCVFDLCRTCCHVKVNEGVTDCRGNYQWSVLKFYRIGKIKVHDSFRHFCFRTPKTFKETRRYHRERSCQWPLYENRYWNRKGTANADCELTYILLHLQIYSPSHMLADWW